MLDTTTGQPLAHVGVTVGHARATTDAAGRFTLQRLPPGTATVTLESNDVPTQHLTVRLHPGLLRRDFRACSTTLDYTCAPHTPNAPTQNGNAG